MIKIYKNNTYTTLRNNPVSVRKSLPGTRVEEGSWLLSPRTNPPANQRSFASDWLRAPATLLPIQKIPSFRIIPRSITDTDGPSPGSPATPVDRPTSPPLSSPPVPVASSLQRNEEQNPPILGPYKQIQSSFSPQRHPLWLKTLHASTSLLGNPG